MADEDGHSTAPPPRHFDAAWHEEVTLPKGQRIRLRLVRPDDKERLRAGFATLSPESRYLRFFTQKESLSEAELAYLTECDQERHIALGATAIDEDGVEGEGLGVARCICLPDRPNTAEVAVAVVDKMQGQGLGRLLLSRLVAAAKERGIARLRVEFLEKNTAMRNLVEQVAEDAELLAGAEDGVMAVELALPEVLPDIASDEAPRHSLLYRLLALAAEGIIVVMVNPLLDLTRPIARAIGAGEEAPDEAPPVEAPGATTSAEAAEAGHPVDPPEPPPGSDESR
jgi:GNAT superfamily N-acetyltransferase